MIETMMKKKNVDRKQLNEYLKGTDAKKHDRDGPTTMKLDADETYSADDDVVNKLLADEHDEESVNTFFAQTVTSHVHGSNVLL